MCVQILYSAHMLRVLPKNLVHLTMAAVAVVSSEPFVRKAVPKDHALGWAVLSFQKSRQAAQYFCPKIKQPQHLRIDFFRGESLDWKYIQYRNCVLLELCLRKEKPVEMADVLAVKTQRRVRCWRRPAWSFQIEKRNTKKSIFLCFFFLVKEPVLIDHVRDRSPAVVKRPESDLMVLFGR